MADQSIPFALATTANGTMEYKLDPQVETFKILLTCILALVMFGMGCAVDYDELKMNFKRPVGISIGLLCQILLMPVITYCLIKATSMSELKAIVFMAVGCVPGGTFSNILAYMVDGDMSLSLGLTTLSNLLAFGTVPFWLTLYTWIEKVDESVRIPYSSLGISLAGLVIPIIFGVLFRYKFVRPAKYLARGCAAFGFILLVAVIVAMLVRNNVPIAFSADTFVPVAVLPLAGMLLSYLVLLIPQLELTSAARRTIVIETAIQNGNLSNNIVFLTYAHRLNLFVKVITLPLLYSIAQFSYTLIFMCFYKGWQCRKKFLERRGDATSYEQMEMS